MEEGHVDKNILVGFTWIYLDLLGFTWIYLMYLDLVRVSGGVMD
jgi:hypothetical protein